MAGVAGITESLRSLLENLVDYAGLYPPAALPLGQVAANYEAYRASPEAWMLNRLVLPHTRLKEVRVRTGWRLTLVVDDEPGPLPAEVETLETKAERRLSLPTYCEAPVARIGEGAFAKIRTARATAAEVAWFLEETAARRMPFKATAGLHQPLGSDGTLGFVNVFAAAVLAWQGTRGATLAEVLEEREAGAFRFDAGGMNWRGERAATEAVRAARREFAHSFGSCSFEEPVAGLRELGWLA